MLEKVLDCARPLVADDVNCLEGEVGVSLPESYKAFLLRYNGGLPVPDSFPIEGMPKNPYGVIQVFFGIDRAIESSNIKWNVEISRNDTPSNLFPIACTPSGDVLCLSLSGEDAGSVVLWDYYNA
nr:SMI1/KNR4 family protein [Pirellulales bacterium]